ncbi:Mss4-like [Lasallia pustulata]|uniref:Mss4-like n=1 Tax=Lasallia pustulata TaxID=136370 RepID=A0A1W5CZ84_9LECA|nr:Mss4-like [Lasallia pustulata]
METLKLSCLCGSITRSIDIPKSSLPIPITFCHCESCRHVTGLFCVSNIFLPSTSDHTYISGEPRAYKTSAEVTRFFCGQCGTHCYLKHIPSGLVGVASGVVDKIEDVAEFKAHAYLTDTRDGGLSDWLPLKRWEGWPHQSKEIQPGTNVVAPRPADSTQASEARLRCRCHCGGVQFEITRPNQNSSNLSSPWPDMLVPFHQEGRENATDEKWWLRPGVKYLAGICACRSCRLGSGYDMQPWVGVTSSPYVPNMLTTQAFIPKVNILQVDGKPFSFSMGTLKRYESAEGIRREFCGRCGATCFWRSDERPDLIDVSVGLLEADTGARAEEWLDWCTERVSFEEYAQSKSMISNLSKGLKAWGKERA